MNDQQPIKPSVETNRCPTEADQLVAEIREYTQICDTIRGIIEQKSARLARIRSEARVTCPRCGARQQRLYADGGLLFCNECMRNQDEAGPDLINKESMVRR